MVQFWTELLDILGRSLDDKTGQKLCQTPEVPRYTRWKCHFRSGYKAFFSLNVCKWIDFNQFRTVP